MKKYLLIAVAAFALIPFSHVNASVAYPPKLYSSLPAQPYEGQKMRLYGSNFQSDSYAVFVSMGASPVTVKVPPTSFVNATDPYSYSYIDYTLPSSMGFVVPGSNPTYSMLYVQEQGSGASSTALTVSVRSAQVVPSISSLSTTTAAQASTVYVTGSNIAGSNVVIMDGAQVLTSMQQSASSITFVVPINASIGTHTIQLGEKSGDTGVGRIDLIPLSNSLSFTVTAAAPTAPTITSISPMSAYRGDDVTITGTNLGMAQVTLDCSVPFATKNASATSITFTIPAMSGVYPYFMGAHRVRALPHGTTSQDCANARTAGTWMDITVIPRLATLTSIDHPSVTAGDYTKLTLTGTNLQFVDIMFDEKDYFDNYGRNPFATENHLDDTTVSFYIPYRFYNPYSGQMETMTAGSHTIRVRQRVGSNPLSNALTINVTVPATAPAAPTGTYSCPQGSSNCGTTSSSIAPTTVGVPLTVSPSDAGNLPTTGTFSTDAGAFTPSPTTGGSLSDQIAALQAQLQALLAQQGGTSPSTGGTLPPTSQAPYSIARNILRNLSRGSQGTDVSALQSFLQLKGYLPTNPTGFFGPATQNAVRAFQRDNNLPSTGYVGAMTRAKLNAQ